MNTEVPVIAALTVQSNVIWNGCQTLDCKMKQKCDMQIHEWPVGNIYTLYE